MAVSRSHQRLVNLENMLNKCNNPALKLENALKKMVVEQIDCMRDFT